MTDITAHAHPTPLSLVLRAEGAAIAAVALAVFSTTGGSWWLFAVLILAPDVAMIGYLADNRTGALCYNLAHSYLAPLALGMSAHVSGSSLALQVALIWVAHIGIDRAFGYGLKYAGGFRQTHLGRV